MGGECVEGVDIEQAEVLPWTVKGVASAPVLGTTTTASSTTGSASLCWRQEKKMESTILPIRCIPSAVVCCAMFAT